MQYECASEITGVVVYARGAIVTRRVTVPPLDVGDADLRVSGLPWLAAPGTVRARLASNGRQVVSVQSSPVIPAERALAATGDQPVIEARAALTRAQAELDEMERRRRLLVDTSLDPGLAPRSHGDKIAERTRDALIAHALVADTLEAVDGRIVALEARIRQLEQELRRAEVAREGSSTGDRQGRGRPERAVIVRVEGTGPVAALELSYVVHAARWWPLYTLDISGGGASTVLWLEALIAQESGEDWNGVALSLSTADLVTDARLPELPSLRFGKAQPPRRAGYRPPPTGLDRLFAGYERATTSMRITVRQEVTIEARFEEERAKRATMAPPMESLGHDDEDEAALDETSGSYSALADALPAPAPQSMPRGGFGSAMAEAPARMRAAPKMARRSMAIGGGGAPGGPPFAPPSMAMAMDALEGAPPMGQAETEPGTSEPSESWLDFDRLRLAGPRDPHRGRLYLYAEAGGHAETSRGIAMVAPGAEVIDPIVSRGNYDHRWDADGRALVPSDARPHRLRLSRHEARPRFRFWTVPRENAEVYREASLDNPTGGPLLSGPMDVYIDGSLLMTAPVAHVDRGGVVRVGLGVEERLKVARNARVEEDAAGLLGGSTAVDHHVSIELASALGQPATVEVLDRVPVTDDKALEVKKVAEDPPSEPYKQDDRGAPIRGGLRWKIALAPGTKRTVKLHYRLQFAAKNEIVGGNRRE